MEACKCYSKNIAKADIILCNLNPSSFSQVLGVVSRFRDQYSRPRLVVRIDGPVSGIRNTDTELDRSFIKFINIAADAVVFQSDWSRRRMIEIAPITSPNTCVISNAPDKNLFTRRNQNFRYRRQEGQETRHVQCRSFWSYRRVCKH